MSPSLQRGAALGDIAFDMHIVKGWLRILLDDGLVPLKIAKSACQDLHNLVVGYLPNQEFVFDKERQLNGYDIFALRRAVEEVAILISAELQETDSYFVDQKGAYSTKDLIEHAEIIFSAKVRKTIPDRAIKDVQQAGRALVFDLPTAAGFHIVRATESVIRKYYDIVVGGQPKKRDWGYYIEQLKGGGADAKIVAAIDQMRNLDRNPLIHPEAVLTEEDALALFGIAQSVILRMVLDIQKREQAASGITGLAPPPGP